MPWRSFPMLGANYLDQIYDNTWLAAKGIELLTRAQPNEHLRTKHIFEAASLCNGNGTGSSHDEELIPVPE